MCLPGKSDRGGLSPNAPAACSAINNRTEGLWELGCVSKQRKKPAPSDMNEPSHPSRSLAMGNWADTFLPLFQSISQDAGNQRHFSHTALTVTGVQGH